MHREVGRAADGKTLFCERGFVSLIRRRAETADRYGYEIAAKTDRKISVSRATIELAARR